MFKPACWITAMIVIYGLVCAALFSAEWHVTSPNSKNSIANNLSITASGSRPGGKLGRACLRKENGMGNYVDCTSEEPVTLTDTTSWSKAFTPPAVMPPEMPPRFAWGNGNYRAYVEEDDGSPNDEGETFTVVDPP
jgi:hypothetical protein